MARSACDAGASRYTTEDKDATEGKIDTGNQKEKMSVDSWERKICRRSKMDPHHPTHRTPHSPTPLNLDVCEPLDGAGPPERELERAQPAARARGEPLVPTTSPLLHCRHRGAALSARKWRCGGEERRRRRRRWRHGYSALAFRTRTANPRVQGALGEQVEAVPGPRQPRAPHHTRSQVPRQRLGP